MLVFPAAAALAWAVFAYVCIERVLVDDCIWLIRTSILHLPHSQYCSDTDCSVEIGKVCTLFMFSFFHRTPSYILTFQEVSLNVLGKCILNCIELIASDLIRLLSL